MDPNANLQEQERLIEQHVQAFGRVRPSSDLRELQSALREWLDRGGFAPDWSQAPRAAKYYEH